MKQSLPVKEGKEIPPQSDSEIYGWLYEALINIISEAPRTAPNDHDIMRNAYPMNPNKTGIHAHRLYVRYGLLANNRRLYMYERKLEQHNIVRNYKSPIHMMWDLERAFSATWFAIAHHYAHCQRRNVPRWNFAKDSYVYDVGASKEYVREKNKLAEELKARATDLEKCVERVQQYIAYHDQFQEE